MTRLSDSLRIILIHGMAEKPPEDKWLGLWRDALTGSLMMEDRALGARIADDPDLLVSAYWADVVPDHLPTPPARVSRAQRSVSAMMDLRRKYRDAMHIPQSGWGDSEIRRFGKAAVEALCQSLGVKPELTQAHMAELNRHHSNPVMAERVRRPLEDRLREAWDRDCRVILIAHSLGAAIAYDALWRFTHRRDPDLQRYRRRKVDLLVTMGSPLGDPRMWNVMLCKCWLESRHAATATERRRAWPHNIARWHNYSALGDLVCHDLDMEALFFEPMRRDLPDYRRDDFRDYRALFNPYRESGGDPNPHKGLGYLIQPKLASQLCRFISTVDSG